MPISPESREDSNKFWTFHVEIGECKVSEKLFASGWNCRETKAGKLELESTGALGGS